MELDETAGKVVSLPADQLALPWMIRVDDEGRATEMRFLPGAGTSARGLLAAVASASQLVHPRGAAVDRWQADEREINGTYTADYVADAEGISKSFTAHTDNEADATGPSRYEATATERFSVAGGHVERVSSSEQGTASVGERGGADRARFESKIELTRLGPAPADLAASADPARFEVFTAASVPARRMPIDPGATFDSLVAEVRKDVDANAKQKRLVARNDLTRVVADDPKAAVHAAQMIKAGGLSEPLERTLIEALVGAGSQAAQAQVAKLIGDDALDPDTRLRMLTASVLLQNPGPEVLAALDSAAYVNQDDLFASQAAVTLGAAALAVARADSHQGEAMTKRLVQKAAPFVQAEVQGGRSSGTPEMGLSVRQNWIAALGNSAAPAALPLLLKALTDPEAPIRASAAHALRFQDPRATLQPMEQAWRSEENIAVRKALLHAARTMGPAVMESFVTHALLFDHSEYVRLEAAYAVATWEMNAPGLRRVLAEALAGEKSPKVQEALKNFLEPGRAAPPFRLLDKGGKP